MGGREKGGVRKGKMMKVRGVGKKERDGGKRDGREGGGEREREREREIWGRTRRDEGRCTTKQYMSSKVDLPTKQLEEHT